MSVQEQALRARKAARNLALMSRAEKDAALVRMANALVDQADRIERENALDVQRAREAGTNEAIIDRLTLNHERIAGIAQGLRDVATLADPVGRTVQEFDAPQGLHIVQRAVPFGVVAMIYEARPNVTVDAAGLCFKSGNAVLLRGSSSAENTNRALVEVMQSQLSDPDAIQLVVGGHETVQQLMTARGLVDVIIPRGGAGLINSVVEGSTVPVIETGIGNCHVYVDASADQDIAVDIVVNAKTQRTSVCNTAETFLVHRAIADEFLPKVLKALAAKDVTIHGDETIAHFASDIAFVPATDDDWAAEYYSLDYAAGVVDDVDAAIEHIRQWTTGHTEAVVATDADVIEKFTRSLDSAAIMVNASTRFTDGSEFGFGAEIGISTQKLHARGPMGLNELTTTTYIVTGHGHIRN